MNNKDRANYQQLKDILDDSESLKKQLGLSKANFMIPVDGNGLRIQVAALKGECDPGISTIDWETVGGQVLEVMLEISEDFQPITTQDKKDPTEEE